MKKAIVINYMGRKGGGALDAYEIAKAFVENGECVIAVVSQYLENLSEWENLALEKLIAIPTYQSKKSFIMETMMFPIKHGGRIKHELEIYEITDVYSPMDAFWNLLVERCCPGAKVTVALHDPVPHSGASKVISFYSRCRFQCADIIVVHSKKFVDFTKKRYKKPTYYIPLGRHNLYKKCLDKKNIVVYDAEKINFLFFGRITEYKGLGVLADAYRNIAERMPGQVTLTIIGNGDFMPYEKMYRELPDVRKIIRWIKDEEVESVFTGENLILVCPYTDATQSGVVLVAQDYGVPVLATKTGAIEEQVEDGKSGILVEAGNAASLTEAMVTLAKDSALREQMGRYAKESMEKLSWTESAKKLVNIWKS